MYPLRIDSLKVANIVRGQKLYHASLAAAAGAAADLK